MRRSILFLAISVAWAQPVPTMPAWLVPFPGAAPTNKTAGEVAESAYTASAPPEAIIDHYKKLFAEASLPFSPNFDGLGNTIRAAAPECDLLLKIREQSSGTSVKISCAPKSAAPAGAVVTGNAASSPAKRSFDQIRQEQDEKSRQMRAQFDAKSRAGFASMNKFDQPVQPKPLPHPLRWPGWLQAMGNGDTCSHPESSPESKQANFHCKYTTLAPMSKLHQFYLDLLKSHDYTIVSARLTAGSTASGIQQNSSGMISAMRHTDDRPNGATEHVNISFNRFYVNEPIAVSIVLTAYPGMGN